MLINIDDPLSALGGGFTLGVLAVTPSMGVIGYMSIVHEQKDFPPQGNFTSNTNGHALGDVHE